MGLTTVLQDEQGASIETVEDPHGLLNRVLSSVDDTNCPLAATIDWYGDSVFNHIQAKKLLGEWSKLLTRSPDSSTTELLQNIQKLLERCTEHLYVKFYGD
jgi:hypothetical protein